MSAIGNLNFDKDVTTAAQEEEAIAVVESGGRAALLNADETSL